MPADALQLVTLGASASAGMVLTTKAGIFCLQHQQSYSVPKDIERQGFE